MHQSVLQFYLVSELSNNMVHILLQRKTITNYTSNNSPIYWISFDVNWLKISFNLKLQSELIRINLRWDWWHRSFNSNNFNFGLTRIKSVWVVLIFKRFALNSYWRIEENSPQGETLHEEDSIFFNNFSFFVILAMSFSVKNELKCIKIH